MPWDDHYKLMWGNPVPGLSFAYDRDSLEGIQLIGIGHHGEYIGRAYTEVKRKDPAIS